MKKFIAILAVLAVTGFSAMAFAADVTVGGSYEIRSRDFNGLNMSKDVPVADSGNARDTQTRIRIDVNAKAGDVKGKLQLEHDFGVGASDWGAFENYSVSSSTTSAQDRREGLGFREAWVMFPLPGIPVTVKAGHQLLQLGNGWFFRSQHYGSDAWVVFNDTGPNHLGFVNVKISEGNLYTAAGVPAANNTATNIAAADDADAYVIVDTFKLNDNNKIGADLTFLTDRRSALAFPGTSTELQNLGLNYNGKLGPLALKAELDLQSGKMKNVAGTDVKFKGNSIVLEGSFAMDPLTINVWLGRGTGNKAGSNDFDQFVALADIDPHYTFLYEYKIVTAAGSKNSNFSNTTAIGLGAMFNLSKSLSVGGNFWFLQATEKTNVASNVNANFTDGADSDKIGSEIDVILNWKLYDNLTWNWVAGYFAPGDVYKGTYTPTGQEAGTEATTGIQGILSYKF